MTNQKKLLITKCTDKLMWYADKVGQTVPYLGEKYGYYTSRGNTGWVNVVNMDDAVVVGDKGLALDKNRDFIGMELNSEYLDMAKKRIQENPHSTSLPRCTRVEVIDSKGRSYVNWEEGNVVKFEIQDDGKTLKVFISKQK